MKPTRVTVDSLMEPISASAPAGTDLRYADAYTDLRALKRAADAEPFEKNGWNALADTAVETLGRSKDLQVAVWLLEAWSRVNGFSGAALGLVLLRRLVEQFWDSLHPAIDPDDDEPLGFRVGVMEWVTDRLPDILKAIPLTTVKPYGVLHYEVTQKTGAAKQAILEEGTWPSAEELDKAFRSAPLPFIEQLLAQIGECEAELKSLDAACDARFVERGRGILSFHAVRETLESARWLVQRTLKSVKPEGLTGTGVDKGLVASAGVDVPALAPLGQPSGGDDAVWQQAFSLVGDGRTDGLRLAQDHLTSAASGREAFLRQLQLAELCMQAGVHALAFPLLDELGRIVDERKLEEWEDKSVLRRVWSGLAQCCRAMATYRPACAARADEAEGRLGAMGENSAAPEQSEPMET